jgi:hypothetical protein
MDTDTFLQYILEKYFVFDPLAELDESNTIDEVDILKRRVNTNIKRVDDNTMIELAKQVFLQFRCFQISVDFKDKPSLTSSEASIVYNNYKKYRCTSSTKTRETETSLRLDESLNTKDTSYVGSLDYITTKQLQCKFGDYLHTGTKLDRYRYEYRLIFTKGGKRYIFSLYDYVDEFDNFYKPEDIYWHVSSNTEKQEVVDAFFKSLEMKLKETQETEETQECC